MLKVEHSNLGQLIMKLLSRLGDEKGGKKYTATHESLTCDPKFSVRVPCSTMKTFFFYSSVELISSLLCAVFKSYFISYYFLCCAFSVTSFLC